MNDIGFRKKRVFAGLALLIVAVALGFLLDGFTGPDSKMWQRLVFIFAVIGTGAAGIVCTFLGWIGVLCGYGFVIVIAVINFLPQVLPQPWNRYTAFLYLLLLFAWPVLKKRKVKGSKTGKKSKPAKKAPKEKTVMDGQATLLVHGQLSGNYYQLVRTIGEIRAYFLGGELKGIDPQLLQESGTPLRAAGKKDITISVDAIKSVKIVEYPETAFYDYALIVNAGRKHRFCPLASEDIDKYIAFFQPWIRELSIKGKSAQHTEEAPALDQKRLALLRKIYMGYNVYILLVSLCWLFLKVPYMLFSLLAIIALPVLMVLYILFPEYYTILEKTRSTRNISIVIPALGSGPALLLRTIMDFNILKWGRFLLLYALALAVCTAVMLLLTKEWKRKKVALFHLLFIFAIYLPGVIGQVNCTFDYHEPQVSIAEVTNLSISRSSRSPDRYNVDVVLEDGTTMQLETNPEHYDALREGDKVKVSIQEGTLGISHAYLN